MRCPKCGKELIQAKCDYCGTDLYSTPLYFTDIDEKTAKEYTDFLAKFDGLETSNIRQESTDRPQQQNGAQKPPVKAEPMTKDEYISTPVAGKAASKSAPALKSGCGCLTTIVVLIVAAVLIKLIFFSPPNFSSNTDYPEASAFIESYMDESKLDKLQSRQSMGSIIKEWWFSEHGTNDASTKIIIDNYTIRLKETTVGDLLSAGFSTSTDELDYYHSTPGINSDSVFLDFTYGNNTEFHIAADKKSGQDVSEAVIYTVDLPSNIFTSNAKFPPRVSYDVFNSNSRIEDVVARFGCPKALTYSELTGTFDLCYMRGMLTGENSDNVCLTFIFEYDKDSNSASTIKYLEVEAY